MVRYETYDCDECGKTIVFKQGMIELDGITLHNEDPMCNHACDTHRHFCCKECLLNWINGEFEW